VLDIAENKFHPDTERLTNDSKSCNDLIGSKDASSNEAAVLPRDSEITNHSKVRRNKLFLKFYQVVWEKSQNSSMYVEAYFALTRKKCKKRKLNHKWFQNLLYSS
jgi:hypothetical protein